MPQCKIAVTVSTGVKSRVAALASGRFVRKAVIHPILECRSAANDRFVREAANGWPLLNGRFEPTAVTGQVPFGAAAANDSFEPITDIFHPWFSVIRASGCDEVSLRRCQGGRNMMQTTVAGLGAMGSELARALLNAGQRVTVWNRTSDTAAPLVEAGAQEAGTLGDAVEASPVTIFCIKSHDDTRKLCADLGSACEGKIVVDLSTGSADEAEALAADLERLGARWQIGMINVYPRDIGKPDASIFTVGPEDVWDDISARLEVMAGASRRIGSEPRMLAALFAAMFTTRQGFMFGMLHGAALAKAAGLEPNVFAETLPISVGLAEAYSETFRRTVLTGNYSDPGASIGTYQAAFDDALGTFKTLSAPDDLPRLLSRLVREASDAGLSDQELTAIYKFLVAQIGRDSGH